MAFVDPLQSGTITMFRSTTAITGWTKLTTYNDYTLRIVTGTASTGGSSAFSSVFSTSILPSGTFTSTVSPVTGPTALTVPQLPLHQHGPYMTNPYAIQQTTSGAVPAPAYPGSWWIATLTSGNYMAGPSTATNPYTYVGPGSTTAITVSPTGAAAGGHTHPLTPAPGSVSCSAINFSVKYVDVIQAQKN